MNFLRLTFVMIIAGAAHIAMFSLFDVTSKPSGNAELQAQDIPIVDARMMDVLPVEIDLPEFEPLEVSVQNDIEKEIANRRAAKEAARKAATEKAAREAAKKAEEAKRQKAEAAKKAAAKKQAQPAKKGAQKSAAKPAKKATAPKASKAQIGQYKSAVLNKIARTRQRRAGKPGVAVIGIRIGGNGALAGISVAQSSGNASTDKAAVAHVQRAAPFGATPRGQSVNMNIKVRVQ